MTERGRAHEVQTPGRRIAEVTRPDTLEGALRLLADDPARRPIAGGTDLLLDLARGGPGDDARLVDLSCIPGFDSVEDRGHELVLGGGVRHGQVVGDVRFLRRTTPLAQACLEIGSPQLRNRATLAGNLATASPANDSVSALMAMGAQVTLSSFRDGVARERVVPVTELATGFRRTVIEPHELITAITVPTLAPGEKGLWVKLGNRKAQAISVIHAAVVLGFDGPAVTSARLAVGSMAATVVDTSTSLTSLVGRVPDDGAIAFAVEEVAARFTPIDDVRATADYRREVFVTLLRRTLRTLRDGDPTACWPRDPPLLRARRGHGRNDRVSPPHPMVDDRTAIEVDVNGTAVTSPGAAGTNLLDWLRSAGGVGDLDGTKEGCAEGECGACTIQLDGAAVMSCVVSAAQADGCSVRTVEGLANGAALHPLQQAFVDEFAVQCGFCTPGFLVAGAALLDEVASPTEDQIEHALSGNLCRCTGYYPIIAAVRSVAARGDRT